MARRTLRSIMLGALACLLLAPAAAGQARPEPQTTLPEVEREVMCPVCGTLLELAAEAPQAQRQRALIRDLIARGYTKDEIKDALVAEFGPEVLAVPEAKGFDLAAWLVPAAAFLAGAVAIAVGLRRWRRRGGNGEQPGGNDDARPLAEDDAKRLDEDLARYKL